VTENVGEEVETGRRDGTSAIALRRAEFFRALPPDRLEQIEPMLIIKTFKRGKVLYFEGQPADLLWTVCSGQIRLYKSSSDGRITSLDVLESGQLFGAVSALRSEDYPCSAEAVKDGSAWCLPRRTFLRLLSEVPATSVEVLEVVSRRLSDAHERVRSFAHDSAASRLAQALLRAARDGEAIVTRRALAETAGTTVETSIRVLRSFERDHLIEGKVGRILLRDEDAIEDIAAQSRTHGRTTSGTAAGTKAGATAGTTAGTTAKEGSKS
jgi:CRP/FNR family transcriptional regulator